MIKSFIFKFPVLYETILKMSCVLVTCRPQNEQGTIFHPLRNTKTVTHFIIMHMTYTHSLWSIEQHLCHLFENQLLLYSLPQCTFKPSGNWQTFKVVGHSWNAYTTFLSLYEVGLIPFVWKTNPPLKHKKKKRFAKAKHLKWKQWACHFCGKLLY